MKLANLLAPLPAPSPDEVFQPLLSGGRFRMERIVSTGHTTPDGQWYDQDADEWVVLLSGAARLRIDGHDEPISLRPGDYLNLSAGVRHRVEWTDPDRETVWLAIHYEPRDV